MLTTEIKVYSQNGLGYFVSYVDPFTKRKVKKRIGEKEAAEQYRDELQEKFTQEIRENPGEMLVQDLMQIHLRNNPKTELARAQGLLSDFLETFGTLRLKEITTDLLRSWIERLRIENDYAESSLFGVRVKVNIFFRDLVRQGVLEVSPVEGLDYRLRPEVSMRKPTFLSEEQLKVLLEQAKSYSPGLFYPLFLTFAETAAKTSEILSLKWDAIDFKKGTITFPSGEILAKRTLPISQDLQACLMRKRPAIEQVFTGIYDQKITVRILATYLNEFKRQYGIQERWNYLDLRHSYARNFLARGGDLGRLKEILGVRSLQTVEVVYGIHHAKRLEISSPYEEG